jgi:hypothetical protein
MAVVTFIDPEYTGNYVLISWNGMANGDTGKPFEGCDWADRSMQIEGTFGTGGTLVMEGSLDGTNYHPLRDSNGSNLTFTQSDLESVIQITKYLRPRVSAGDGATSLNVTMFARRSRS